MIAKVVQPLKKLGNTNVKSRFLKNILVLAGGTAFAQGLLALCSPVLTRLYTPADFGLLQTYVSVLSIAAVIASWRYEMTIPLPKSDRTAASLLVLSMMITFFMGGVMAVIFFLFQHELEKFQTFQSLIDYLWLLLLSFLGVGIYQSLNYWAVRKGAFKDIARTKVTQSFGQIAIQVVFGLLMFRPSGLLLGDAAGRVMGSGRLSLSLLKEDSKVLKEITVKSIIESAKRYRSFPLISSWSALLNGIGQQLAPLLIISFFGAAAGGWFALGQRVIGMPMLLIGKSVSQVYFGEASDRLKKNEGIMDLYQKTAVKLFLIGVLPIAVLFVGSPYLFSLFFGTEWREAGLYVQSLSLMFLGHFVVVPLSQTLYIIEKQSWQFYWDLGRVVIILAIFMVVKDMGMSAGTAVMIYGMFMFAMYAAHYLLTVAAIKQMDRAGS
ncbi:lipopolysaccharide biosynthesis protein [Fictibacillus sp. KIGAM418]|uniref:Lipopolysaccharide biosynthesis protein n=1 Tax=Fictibacillus marinisediminis TaxID=2878389 RepID=A0A9X2BEN9_9BACL|nr:lipopolysaccharide biosynthesis protein [Fictibacillus marinisediminis]MCK6258821.1 lipopolysaccharide biosynthesis protein [Fictibacillus marinisediminis]